MKKSKPKIVVIAGPTAVGKTECSIRLAKKFDAEIVSADSMQVYRGMDVGTAKPSLDERSGVKFWLIDVTEPDEPFSVGRYVELARQAIEDIYARGKRAVVCGGTGLYIRALTKGLVKIPSISEETKKKVSELEARLGVDGLYKHLVEVDPKKASEIEPTDAKRIRRALEVFYETKKPLSEWQESHGFSEEPYECLKIALYRPRGELYEVINRRVDAMFDKGWLDEVKRLWARGLAYSPTARWAIGYNHLFKYLERGGELEIYKELIKRDTRRYAKRQLQWFKAEKDFIWLRYPEDYEKIEKKVDEFW